MKAILSALVLSFALLFSPGLARADNNVPSTPSGGSAAEMAAPKEFDVVGVSLSPLYKDFTGKLTIKAFLLDKGILKVKVAIKGWIVDINGVLVYVNVDDHLVAIVDLDASCDVLKVSLGIFKVKVLGLDIMIRIDDALIVVNSSQCDKKKLCELSIKIHGKKHCFLIVKLLNQLWGFCDKDCDCDCDGDHGGGGHGGGGHGGGGHGGGGCDKD